jgi:hypothetical protein
MNRSISLFLIALVSSGLAACGGGERAASPTETPTSSPEESPAASPAVEGEFGSPTPVLAQANIFGAGRDEPPDPGGGGAGELPPVWHVPEGARVVTFPTITGTVNPLVGEVAANGPAGDGHTPTDVESYQGISGIENHGNGMFLVGVFLTDDPPSGRAPRRLDFTDGEDFDVLAPEVGQTFLIGDGKGRAFRVPPGATRLFLGFADAAYFNGNPGWYNNNVGQLSVTVEVETG